MGTNVEFKDKEAFQAALSAVRSDQAEHARQSWVLIGHVDNNPSVVSLVDTDNSSKAQISDFVSKLSDDQVQYGMLRYSVTLDMSVDLKFIYVNWIGSKVPASKKSRFGVVHGSVRDFFGNAHCNITTSSRDDLTLDAITQKIKQLH